MKLVSLEPSLTELVAHFGLEGDLLGVSHDSDFPESIRGLPKVTFSTAFAPPVTAQPLLQRGLSEGRFTDIEVLLSLNPEVILTSLKDPETLRPIRDSIKTLLGEGTSLFTYNPMSLEGVYETFEKLARDLKIPEKGKTLSHRLKAQIMDWSDNFYNRMKNKKVTFLASLNPYRLGGAWIADMIRSCSAISQVQAGQVRYPEVSWGDIVNFAPDVIVVAPEDTGIKECMQSFKVLEKLPEWEQIPAVKRGEVFFTDGIAYFHKAGPRLFDSFGVLVSAIAGLDAGYIAPRESLYRLRWLELQRHKI